MVREQVGSVANECCAPTGLGESLLAVTGEHSRIVSQAARNDDAFLAALADRLRHLAHDATGAIREHPDALVLETDAVAAGADKLMDSFGLRTIGAALLLQLLLKRPVILHSDEYIGRALDCSQALAQSYARELLDSLAASGYESHLLANESFGYAISRDFARMATQSGARDTRLSDRDRLIGDIIRRELGLAHLSSARLLVEFLRNSDRFLRSERLASQVGYAPDSIKALVTYLRRDLEGIGLPGALISRRKLGYRLDPCVAEFIRKQLEATPGNVSSDVGPNHLG